jgi:hypothetical protein
MYEAVAGAVALLVVGVVFLIVLDCFRPPRDWC